MKKKHVKEVMVNRQAEWGIREEAWENSGGGGSGVGGTLGTNLGTQRGVLAELTDPKERLCGWRDAIGLALSS